VYAPAGYHWKCNISSGYYSIYFQRDDFGDYNNYFINGQSTNSFEQLNIYDVQGSQMTLTPHPDQTNNPGCFIISSSRYLTSSTTSYLIASDITFYSQQYVFSPDMPQDSSMSAFQFVPAT
jgi:hypothetical protein